MKFHFHTKLPTNDAYNQLLEDIEKTKCALEMAYTGLDSVVEPDLIDAYIYELNAVHKRYHFLLKEAANYNLLPPECLYQEPSVVTLTT